MIKHRLSIVWGTKKSAIIPNSIKGYPLASLENNHPLIQLQKEIGAHSVVFNHQVHGTVGHNITHTNEIPQTLLTTESDFLITNQPGIALGILTADCLPLVLYSPEKHVVSLIHAGWKGAVQGIIQKAITTLENDFSINPATLTVACGPAAQVCCYEVKNDFYEHFKNDPNAKNCFEQRDNKLFFSLSRYANALLDAYNIPAEQRDFSAHCCTVCTDKYYSYRRDKNTEYRNITLVSLKSFLSKNIES